MEILEYFLGGWGLLLCIVTEILWGKRLVYRLFEEELISVWNGDWICDEVGGGSVWGGGEFEDKGDGDVLVEGWVMGIEGV